MCMFSISVKASSDEYLEFSGDTYTHPNKTFLFTLEMNALNSTHWTYSDWELRNFNNNFSLLFLFIVIIMPPDFRESFFYDFL